LKYAFVVNGSAFLNIINRRAVFDAVFVVWVFKREIVFFFIKIEFGYRFELAVAQRQFGPVKLFAKRTLYGFRFET
jgi:hypothetical protein